MTKPRKSERDALRFSGNLYAAKHECRIFPGSARASRARFGALAETIWLADKPELVVCHSSFGLLSSFGYSAFVIAFSCVSWAKNSWA